jgi:hypothetical protein
MAFCFERKLTTEATKNAEGIGFRSSAPHPSPQRVPRLASNERTRTWGTNLGLNRLSLCSATSFLGMKATPADQAIFYNLPYSTAVSPRDLVLFD